jgi:hypothetical protein
MLIFKVIKVRLMVNLLFVNLLIETDSFAREQDLNCDMYLQDFKMSPSRPRDKSKVAQKARGRENEIFSREHFQKSPNSRFSRRPGNPGLTLLGLMAEH